MAIYCGVDFHARQQTVCYCDTADGEIRLAELDHGEDNVRGFYSRFAGELTVGIEASGYSTWFIELLEGLGHRGYCQLNLMQRWIRQKNKSYPSPSATSSLNNSPLQAAT